jgi:recA bacterial DNA recombination protein
MFYHQGAMTHASPDVTAALATLQARWGSAAPRVVGEVVGALATVPLPSELAALPEVAPRHDEASVVPTGFAALDAILGLGGVPRQAGLALRGDHSSGKTTLAMRLVAEAQAAGSIAAWLDLSRSLDPVEAVARGIRLEWLVILTPESLDEGLAMAGSLVQGRAVDLLVVDLAVDGEGPARSGPPGEGAGVARRTTRAGPPGEGAGVARRTPVGTPTGLPGEGAGVTRRTRSPGVADRLRRLAAIARRAGVLLVVLEPPGLPSGMTGALAEVAGLRLEVARRTWIRLGRDVVGQRMEVTVARNRFGPAGRRADLRILYADGGERDRCLGRDPLLREAPATPSAAPVPPLVETSSHAPPPSPLAASPAPSRPVALHVVSVDGRRLHRPDRPRRPAVDAGHGARRESGRDGPGRPARTAAGDRTPAGA